MAQETAGIQTQQSETTQSTGNFLQNLGGTLAAVSGPLGLAVGLAGSVMSFAEAKKQRENQVAAQLEADKAFEEAGRILQEQYTSGVSIPLEAYEDEREGIAQAGAQAIQALTEGEARGAAGGVGRVVALQNSSG
jgi:phosphoribosylamine-glycine ligase